MSLRLVAASLLALGCAAPSHAAPRKHVAPAPEPVKAVSLENKRLVSLLTFEITMQAAGSNGETVIGKLEKPLAGGQSASLRLTGAKGCLFQAKWSFEDARDQGSVNLCNDTHIVLID